MSPQEARALNDSGLSEALEQAREDLFNLRFRRALGQLSDTSTVRAARRTIARLHTIQHERQLWAAYEPDDGGAR